MRVAVSRPGSFAGPGIRPYLCAMSTEADRLSPALDRALANFAAVFRRVCWRYRLTDADADELLQEVRIRLWRAHGEAGHEQIAAIPASYVHRTALSAAVDLLRRRRARRADHMVELDEEQDDAPEPITATRPAHAEQPASERELSERFSDYVAEDQIQ